MVMTKKEDMVFSFMGIEVGSLFHDFNSWTLA
jgi:hypothetical protein